MIDKVFIVLSAVLSVLVFFLEFFSKDETSVLDVFSRSHKPI